ncbi:rRNA maturation RNase YbeY [Selenomonas sp. TAMA-11512]|uniref:rRNA maturation RNase YbeY n=1 Tax=Selenomonas sp. TAMA-11512 TaxID=3095337 RepID=UPI0030883BD4|nr:rRNA maturation RNase YbeY [Selenomonas sp. TAMA-11512]
MTILTGTEPEELTFDDAVWEPVFAAVQCIENVYEIEATEVSITLTNDAYIHTVNREYRGIDRPTDVISFALQESEEPEITDEGYVTLGDILISVERAEAQASEYGHSLRRELAFLTVHGMLHLLGFDHIEEEDRREMEAAQTEIIEKLGITRD